VNLVADVAGAAPNVDPDMINAWGIALDDQNHAFWIADNGSGKVSIVDGTGAPVASQKIDVGDGITGVANNPSASAFLMHTQAACAAARMVFSSEAGQIIAVNEAIDAARGMVMVDRSDQNAVYKSIAIIELAQPQAPSMFRILAADFHNARIDVFDESFQLVNPVLPTTGAPNPMFVDAAMPVGYAPFNVVVLGDKVYVTFAKQDDMQHDDVQGAGLGALDEFDMQGNFIRTIMPVGQLLNAPWGIARAPGDFCKSTANALLVGNFGDGHITAIDVESGRLLGQLGDANGQALAIEGLWGLMFGDAAVGQTSSLYFTAGPGDEGHGLFGYLTANESSK
jgi:uncharacterized protein (TIGR03118 family)